ncbi:MAG: CapA family protein [Gemmatimonadetes bacterium]|nr:CapA family protein [Gemmatimonadota bacterium]
MPTVWTAAVVVALLAVFLGPPSVVRAQDGFADADGNITMALTGDAIISRQLSAYAEPPFLRMIEIIRNADVGFTNLEILLHNYEDDVIPSIGYLPRAAGTYMRASPDLARELAWAGFNIVARANNHAVDFGIGGIRATDRALDAAGLVHAGTGDNLALARSPGYLETAGGRVAFISAASSFPDFGAAGPQRPDLRGRPGLNPIRYETTYVLPGPYFEQLGSVASVLGSEGSGGGREQLRFIGQTFVRGNEARTLRTLNEVDLEEILASVRDAKRQANWVIVTVHSHERGATREEPADFLIEFAHAVIDAGADVFAGHGPHLLKGVEIYRGRPIFYSLGNFMMQNETVRFQAGDNYRTLGLPPTALPSDFYDERERTMGGGWPTDPTYWESAVAVVEFRAGELRDVRLHPITMGFGLQRPQRGRAMLANPELSRKIIHHLAELSRPFDTQIEFEDGVGRVILSGSSSSGTRR